MADATYFWLKTPETSHTFPPCSTPFLISQRQQLSCLMLYCSNLIKQKHFQVVNNRTSLKSHQPPSPLSSCPFKLSTKLASRSTYFRYGSSSHRTTFRIMTKLTADSEPSKFEYRIGRGEQGVLTFEPYKSELLPLWRFRTVELATKSSQDLWERFEQYEEGGDFVGMDMARKFIQMVSRISFLHDQHRYDSSHRLKLAWVSNLIKKTLGCIDGTIAAGSQLRKLPPKSFLLHDITLTLSYSHLISYTKRAPTKPPFPIPSQLPTPNSQPPH